MLRHVFRGKARAERVPLFPPFRSDRGNAWMATAPWPMPDDMAGWRDGLTTCLYEDGVRLLRAHIPHDAIRTSGGGLYSHFGRRIWFSTSDNSDPNTNGRRYEVDFTLDLATWKRAFLQALTPLWDLHPDAAMFRAHGSDEIPPPIFCSLGLTNKCNLRCECCGGIWTSAGSKQSRGRCSRWSRRWSSIVRATRCCTRRSNGCSRLSCSIA